MGSGTSGKGSSSSRSSSTTNNTTQTNVDNRVYQSDFGAVESSLSLGGRVVDAMSDVSRDALELGRSGLDAGTDNLNLGLGFAQDIYGDTVSTVNGVIDRLAENQDSALSRLADNQDSALSFLSDLVDSFGQSAMSFTDQAVSGFETLAKKSSESADDRVGKVAMWAFIAVGAVFIFGRR